jgi:hypothetical protein
VSINPELILRTVVVKGIETFRNNPKYLEQLFRNLDRDSATQMREYFEQNMIWIDINYPREATKVPAIIILLKSESESQAFLGDHMATGEVPDGMGFDDFSEEVLGGGIIHGAASVSSMSGEGLCVYGPAQADHGTLNTISLPSVTWNIDQYRIKNYTVHIVGGKGVGQQRKITTNSRDTLMVTPNWNVVPDSTSIFVIRSEEKEIVGEPRSLYPNQTSQFVESKGSYYNTTYQLQVVDKNPEITVYLSTIVKSILTMSRIFLESQGIINMRLSASDFTPRKEYYPDFAYMRAIEVSFQYPFSIYIQPEYATSFNLVLESSCQNGILTVVSNTQVQ